MKRPGFLRRRELSARERARLGVWQTLLWVGVLCTTRGLASAVHWLSVQVAGPGVVAGSNAFSPLDPVPALVALLVGPGLCVVAAVVADRRRPGGEERPPAVAAEVPSVRPLRPAFVTGAVR